MIDINNKNLIKDVKTYSEEELSELSSKIREQILLHASSNGSHLSPNLGTVELTISLCRVFDFPKDKIIFDVGHQSYAYKILTGRKLDHIGSKGATGFFQSRKESEFDIYDAGHSSTSISAAMGFAASRDMKHENFDVIAFIGDSSLANGIAMEAINHLASFPHKVIVVINDNDMSISPAIGGLNHHLNELTSGKIAPEENAFSKLGLDYIGPIDGHDVKKMDEAFEKAKKSSKSVVVHVKTIKGKGYSPAEKDKIGVWHGPEPFDPSTSKPLFDHHDEMSWAEFMAGYSIEMMEKHENSVFFVSGTLLGSSLSPVEAAFKDKGRFIDVGIGEEHAMTMAGAYSLGGIHPIVQLYSCFLQRSYDQISHDCARFNADMTILVDRAGLNGKHGETHQGLYDVAFLNSIPNVTITMPSNESEARALYRESFNNHGVFAIRFPKSFIKKPISEIDNELPFARFSFIKSSSERFAIVSPGPSIRMLENALKDKKITLVNPIYLNNFDLEDIKRLSKFEKIYIFDPTGVKAGFTSILESSLLENGFKGEILSRAIPNSFIDHASLEDQMKDLKLDDESVLKEIDQFFYKD